MNEMKCIERHKIIITDRGGGRKIAQLRDVGSCEYNRSLSASSKGTIEIMGEACRTQAATLAKIQPRRHEMVIYRDNLRVWEGPITEVGLLDDRIVIEASDVVEYLAGTPLSKYWPSPDDGGQLLAANRIKDIITHELTQPYTLPVGYPGTPRTFKRWEQFTPPAGVLPHLDVRVGTLQTSTDSLPFEMSVAEHMTNLANAGLRFTTVGRKLLIWDSSLSIGEIRTLSDKDLGEKLRMFITSRGFTNVQHVVSRAGADPFATDNVGSAGESDEAYWGGWTTIDTLADEEGDNDPEQALSQQAERLYAERSQMKLNIDTPRSGSIRLSDTLTLQMLVPGVVVPVNASYRGRRASARYILKEVSVREDAGGEKVGVTLHTESDPEA